MSAITHKAENASREKEKLWPYQSRTPGSGHHVHLLRVLQLGFICKSISLFYKPHYLFDPRGHCLHWTIRFHFNFPSFQERKWLHFKGLLWRAARCWPVQVRGSVVPAGERSLGGCPLRSLSRPAPSRRGTEAREEKTNMEKYLRLLIMTFKRPIFHRQCRHYS